VSSPLHCLADIGRLIVLNTDSYKASHRLQYPPGTTHTFSYIESRGGEHERTLFFGP
jgi:nicotinamide phosphoribosyltransferase